MEKKPHKRRLMIELTCFHFSQQYYLKFSILKSLNVHEWNSSVFKVFSKFIFMIDFMFWLSLHNFSFRKETLSRNHHPEAIYIFTHSPN